VHGLGAIDHFVVLMLENRSFDNMVGRLYGPGNAPPFDHAPRGQPFDGVSGKRLGNLLPAGAVGPEPHWVPTGRARGPAVPTPGPGEGYAHVNLQLYGRVLPPYNRPAPLPAAAPMGGFALDYVRQLRRDGAPVDSARYGQVMEGFAPAELPVLCGLARAYAVCDRWFCSVPGATWANRSFLLAGTSRGFVDDTPYLQWLRRDAETVLDRLPDARGRGPAWRVYFDPRNILPLTGLIFPRLFRHVLGHFAYMSRFYRDARSGRLPAFTLIEPSMLWWRNDQHPPGSVLPGEALIHDVYTALRSGPAWERTLLLLTYDEHGGLYDHVAPPPAVPPEPDAPAGQYGFRFDRLGPRVCTVLVSPWIEAGTVFRARDAGGREVPCDHTSILRTVCARFGLPPLTARDAAAPDVGGALARTRPRRGEPSLPAPPR